MHYITLLFFLLLVPLEVSAEDPAVYSGKSNPCPEGAFLDVGESQCKTLDKPSFGFKRATFNNAHPTTTVTVSACTPSALQSAISTVSSGGGGTVNVPTCVITFTGSINLPSNILLQGMGSDKTTFKLNANFPHGYFFNAEDKANIILRDIKFIGVRYSGDTRVLTFNGAENLLFERLDVSKMSRAAITAPHAQRWTARYNYFNDNEGNSVGSKDCWPDTSGGVGSISRADCGTGDFWSGDISAYSNRVIDPYNTGLDFHSYDTEVAGNWVQNSGFAHGIKIPEPAERVWVHDNVIIDNEKNGLSNRTQKCATITRELEVKDVVNYRNRIERNDLPGNGSNGFYILYAQNIINIDSIYRNNGANNTWSHSNTCGGAPTALKVSTIYLCPRGNEVNLGNDSGNSSVTMLPAADSRCNLANVANIFN